VALVFGDTVITESTVRGSEDLGDVTCDAFDGLQALDQGYLLVALVF